jgi:hypothetical protein
MRHKVAASTNANDQQCLFVPFFFLTLFFVAVLFNIFLAFNGMPVRAAVGDSAGDPVGVLEGISIHVHVATVVDKSVRTVDRNMLGSGGGRVLSALAAAASAFFEVEVMIMITGGRIHKTTAPLANR